MLSVACRLEAIIDELRKPPKTGIRLPPPVKPPHPMPTLNWTGKEAVINHHRQVPFRLLRCDKSKSAGHPDAGNLPTDTLMHMLDVRTCRPPQPLAIPARSLRATTLVITSTQNFRVSADGWERGANVTRSGFRPPPSRCPCALLAIKSH